MDISESLDRILDSQETFGNSFYDIFFERHPDVQQYFKDVNMKRQAVLLTMALIIVEQYFRSPYPATMKYLRYLGTQHSERSIPKELYPDWKAAMLETLEKFHAEDWNDELAKQWKQAIDNVTAVMFEGYEQHYTV
jgi:hemoglobin-like flavoprotein